MVFYYKNYTYLLAISNIIYNFIISSYLISILNHMFQNIFAAMWSSDDNLKVKA